MSFYQRYKEEAMKIVRNMTVVEVSIFKLTIMISGIYFAKVIPALTSAPQIVYITLFAIGSVYMLRKLDWNKILKNNK